MLSAARLEVRKNFESNRSLAAGSEEYSKHITHAEEVAKFLRENVVQGEATDTQGSYSMFRCACGFADSQTLMLQLLTLTQSSTSTSTPSAGTTRISRRGREIH